MARVPERDGLKESDSGCRNPAKAATGFEGRFLYGLIRQSTFDTYAAAAKYAPSQLSKLCSKPGKVAAQIVAKKNPI